MTNLSTSNLTPGPFIQITIPFGPGSTLTGAKRALIIANKTAAAPALTNVLYGPGAVGAVVANRGQVLSTFGAGSEQNLGYDALVLAYNQVPIWFICPPESVGAAASATITFTGAATSFGAIQTYFNGTNVETNVSNGDSDTVMATNVANSINQQVSWNVSALASGPSVTVTCKNKGIKGNQTYFACQVENGLTGVTSSAQSFAFLAGGAADDDYTATLAVLEGQAFDYIVTAASGVNNLQALISQVNLQNLAVPGYSQRVFDGYLGSQAAQAAFCTSCNDTLINTAWFKNSDYTPIQLAAHFAGVIAGGESQNPPVLNYDDYGVRPGTTATWQFHNPSDGTTTTPGDLQAALISGATPIVTTVTGRSKIAKFVTTYFLDPESDTLDLDATDGCDQFIAFQCRAALVQMWNTQFVGSVAAQNPQPGEKAPNQFVVTPDILTASITKVLNRQISNGLLQDFVVQTPTLQADGRFDAVVEVQPVDLAHQLSLDLLVTTQSLT